MSELQRKNDFTTGPIFGPLVKFTLPILGALILQSLYGAVDLMIVGKFAASADVSAVSTGTQVMHLITNTIAGLSMGTTVLMGQFLGAKRREECGEIIGTAVCFFAAVGLAIALIGPFAAGSLARLMNAPQEAFAPTVSYIRICTIGAVFIVAYNLLGGIFRGMGDSRTPLIAVGIACVMNILGDYICVAKLGMGTSGAALATVISQGFSVALCLVVIKKQGLPFPFGRRNIHINTELLGRSLKMGAPIALQSLLVSISFAVILAIVNDLGLIASAGVGVAEKICAFIMLVADAFSSSLSAFVAQNVGAKRMDRADRALVCGIAASLSIGVITFWLSFFHGDMLAGLFANDSDVVYAAADYLKAYAIDTLFTAFLFCFLGYFNGRGKTTFVMIQGLTSAFGVRIPVAWIMSRRTPVRLFHVALATPCSTVYQIIICTTYFLILRKRDKQ